MSKYASLLFPSDTYHYIGPFRFPVYHDLVPGEAKGIEVISRKQSRSTFKSIKLAQRIAKDKGITTKEAVKLLGGGEDNEDILYDYAPELEELQLENVGAIEQQIAFVTLFMQYRGEAKLPDGDDWRRLDDWTDADTEAIPAKLADQIFQLITWERDGWPQPGGNDEGSAPDQSPPPSNS